jgi:hypothetical protein
MKGHFAPCPLLYPYPNGVRKQFLIPCQTRCPQSRTYYTPTYSTFEKMPPCVPFLPLAKMEFRYPSTEVLELLQEAIFGVSSDLCEPQCIKIASLYRERNASDEVGTIFAGCPFLLVRLLLDKQKKMNSTAMAHDS